MVKGQSWQQTYNEALNAYTQNDYRNTIIDGEKALALISSTNEELFTLKILSATCNEIGNYKKGLQYAKREIEICVEQEVADSVYANSLNNLINNLIGNQQYLEAIPFQRRLVAVGSAIYAEDNLEHNQHTSDLGYSYLMTTNYDSAIYFLNQANEYLIAIEGGAEDYLINQLNIGQAYYQKNEFFNSLKIIEGLKTILESNQLDDYQIYAEAMESLAMVQAAIGKYPEAQQSYEMASNKYLALGFAVDDLHELNAQLAVVYIKNEEVTKSDSVQALYSGNEINKNLYVNQLSLAYKKYTDGDIREANTLLKGLLGSLNNDGSASEVLAETILLQARLNIDLYGHASSDSLDLAIALYQQLGNNEKVAEVYLVKGKGLQAEGNNTEAIGTLSLAYERGQKLPDAYFLKYNIGLSLLNSYLLNKQIGDAQKLYHDLSGQHFVGLEYGNLLTYNYGILLQINGYNLLAIKELTPIIETASYPEKLNYERLEAKINLDIGQVKEALAIYLKIDEYLLGQHLETSIEYGENLTQLARVNVILGEYAIAETYYQSSVDLLEKNPTTPANVFANTYNSLAIFQQTIGNYDKAQLYYSKAKFFAKDDPNLSVDIIQNLATLSQHSEQYYDAIVLLKEALVIYESLYGRNHPYYGTALQNLANAYNKYGDALQAIKLLEEAIRIDEARGLANNISQTNKMHNLAVILQETDELDKAKDLFDTVLKNRLALLGPNHPDYIYTLYNMAVLEQRRANYSQAKAYFAEVIEKYDFQIKTFFPYLSEEEKSKYYGKINEAFTAFQDFAAEYAATDPKINGDLYDFQLNHKAILLNSSKSLKTTIEQANDPQLTALYDQWVDKKRLLAKYYSMSKSELSEQGIILEQVAEQANEIEKKLSLKSALFSDDLVEKTITWHDVQAALGENDAAIEILRIKKNIRNDSIWYAGLIITPEMTQPKLVIFKNGKELEEKQFKLYINSIKFKRQDKQSYKSFWQPIDNELSNIERIFVSSDGIYNKINLSSIYDPDSDEYILDRMVIHNVTNTYELTLQHSPMLIDERFSISLVGDPIFSSNTANEYKINALPGTRIEIETIDSLVQAKNITSIKLLGSGATERNIKQMQSPTILHIATHGFFLADESPDADIYSIDNNPLMRSGLLLSGSQSSYRGNHIEHNSSLTGEDGILTAYEAMNINLSDSKLVILSACETGLGEVKNGEGVYGLKRAFVIAGAQSIMISLWKVDDASTKELMILFYKNILNGDEKFDALNKAQKELKEKYTLPYYWGAFVLNGT